MPIQLFIPTFHTEEVLAEIRECLEKGWTGIGFKTVEFEKEWQKYTSVFPEAASLTGFRSALFLNSATAGLHLALATLKHFELWPTGSEVITTPLTFVSTNEAILYEYLNPVFADVDEYLCLDPKSVERMITPRTKAILFVGIGGNMGRYEEIRVLCRKYNLKLILDASHMAGTKWKSTNVFVGKDADAAVFSFQAVKNLPTADAGLLCFGPDGQADQKDEFARQQAWMGIDKDTYARSNKNGYSWEYGVQRIGWKYNGNSIMAAMALVALRHLEEGNQRRRELCDIYDSLLGDKIERVPMHPDCTPSRHLYQVLVDNRNKVIEQLRDAGIGAGVHYINNLHYPIFNSWRNDDDCPKAEAASRRLLSLPLHLRLTDTDALCVATKLLEITNASSTIS